MDRGRKLALLAGVALVLGLAPMLPASAQRVLYNVRSTFDTTVHNNCTGEDVHLVGELHTVAKDAGGGCVTLTQNVHAEGVGLTSGIQYLVNGSADDLVCQGTTTLMRRSVLISEDNVDNQVLVRTTTCTLDGDVLTCVDEFIDIECRG
jgi:hypothetical protein